MAETKGGSGGIKPPRLRSGEIPAEHQLRLHRQELGMLGYIFGSRENAPFFIGAIIVVFSFIGIFLSIVFPDKQTGRPDGDTLKLCSGLIVAALSFIAGYSGRRNGR
jgi:hypothetical protein